MSIHNFTRETYSTVQNFAPCKYYLSLMIFKGNEMVYLWHKELILLVFCWKCINFHCLKAWKILRISTKCSWLCPNFTCCHFDYTDKINTDLIYTYLHPLERFLFFSKCRLFTANYYKLDTAKSGEMWDYSWVGFR